MLSGGRGACVDVAGGEEIKPPSGMEGYFCTNQSDWGVFVKWAYQANSKEAEIIQKELDALQLRMDTIEIRTAIER